MGSLMIITQSLLSPMVKKIENRSKFAEVMGNKVGVVFFYETLCYEAP